MVQALGNERVFEKTAVFQCDQFLLKVKEAKMDKRSNILPSFPS
jgi:hypothetical protein